MSIVPKYVQIYNEMFNKIQKAEYGAKLPTEKELCNYFKCSRVTIRSVLALLKEDNIVYSVKGKGNYINHSVDSEFHGIELNQSLFYSSCNQKIDRVRSAVKINDASPYSEKIFESLRKYYSINLWYEHEDRIIGNVFSIIDSNYVPDNLDINDDKSVTRFVEKNIYLKSYHTQVHVQRSLRKKDTFHKSFFGEKEVVMLILENLFDDHNKIIGQNKYYIPLKYFDITLNKYSKN
ncbi:DNA-binding GntR family transcriptional regulator [Lactobacillus colini]|uniref:DNA-binding GntR family transcriptional regulator n=1 Tax=Lactobacillus colini TaxID=1819254 RepID=A0ABS4MFQ9_9LACO|nr:GntR family transcriptional regulator [Lactobacillus colini]MBP2058204.1 DNA-binding GntR family transcriptional regulator [Lactobacillus colini]